MKLTCRHCSTDANDPLLVFGALIFGGAQTAIADLCSRLNSSRASAGNSAASQRLKKQPPVMSRGPWFWNTVACRYFCSTPSTPMARKSEYLRPSPSHHGLTLSAKCLSFAALFGYWMIR